MAFLSTPLVALRKESVDRNILRGNEKWKQSASLSARRAWIEIASSQTGCTGRSVALRKESVDRNCVVYVLYEATSSRSPQGERG